MINQESPINICEALDCPFAKKSSPTASSGCRKYPVAFHCHLVHPENGERRYNLQKQSTPYFLYQLSSEMNLAQLKSENEHFLSQPEIVRELEFERKMSKKD